MRKTLAPWMASRSAISSNTDATARLRTGISPPRPSSRSACGPRQALGELGQRDPLLARVASGAPERESLALKRRDQAALVERREVDRAALRLEQPVLRLGLDQRRVQLRDPQRTRAIGKIRLQLSEPTPLRRGRNQLGGQCAM